MSSPDLDALRQRWTAASARIDEHLHMDVAAMRTALAGGTRRAVRAQLPCLWMELATNALLIVALTAFMVAHRHDGLYLATALALVALPVVSLVLGVRQWRAFNSLDYSAPVMNLRATFERLRRRRIRLAQAIAFVAVPLWWPAVAVAFKGLFGADLLRGLPSSVYSVSLMIGVGVIVVMLVLGAWLSRRYGQRAGYQDFLDDVAGLGWRRLRGRLDAQRRFELDLQDEGAASALRTHRAPTPLPAAAAAAMWALRRRLLVAILFYASLVACNGAFNVIHGGEAQFVAPGVLLNLVWIAQMVAAILQRSVLGRLATPLPAVALVQRFDDLLGWRRRIAQRSVVLAPAWGLLATQVLAKAVAGADLLAILGPGPSAVLGVAALSGVSLLAYRYRQRGADFAARAVDLLTLGTARFARALRNALRDVSESSSDSESPR